jgi:alpha-L-fucosidase 2
MVQGLLKFNTLPNMLTTHPPMQMDGNFGIVGGICEMLVQSHAGGLDIMPSPVEAWPEGSVKGLKARGNVTVDFTWKNGKVSNLKLYSDQPKVVPVRVNGKMTRVKTLPLKPVAEARQTAAR